MTMYIYTVIQIENISFFLNTSLPSQKKVIQMFVVSTLINKNSY